MNKVNLDVKCKCGHSSLLHRTKILRLIFTLRMKPEKIFGECAMHCDCKQFELVK